jgi:Ca2+/Na+ antiporter
MFLVSADGEVFGANILNLAVVAGALLLLLATLWTSASPDLPVAQAPSGQQVVVVAHPGHVS